MLNGSLAPVAPTALIDGPPAPVAPEVVSRDAQGHVTIRAVRLTEPLVIDGLLQDPIYSQVPAIGDFVQQEPHEGEPATERTELWIFFDDHQHLLRGALPRRQPDRVIANEMRRDSNNIFQNDNVQLVIDTFYDRRSGVLFQTNALGALSDQEVSDERNFNRDWNTVWDVKGARTDEGWSAEFVIPLKSLRYRASGPQTWGFNIQRRIPWKNERSYLSGVPASYGGRGIYKLSSPPRSSASRSRRRAESRNQAVRDIRGDDEPSHYTRRIERSHGGCRIRREIRADQGPDGRFHVQH